MLTPIWAELKKGTRSIVGRLTLWYIASTFLLVFLATGYLYWSLSKTLSIENNAILENRLQTIKSLLNRKSDALPSIKRRIEFEWLHWHFEKIFVRIVNNKNELLAESATFPTDVIPEIFSKIAKSHLTSGNSLNTTLKTKSHHAYRILIEHFNDSEITQGTITVYLALDLNHETEILTNYEKQLALVLFVTFLLCILIGVQISKSGFKPVQDMIETANNIKLTTLHERISEANLPIELKKLASTMNKMLNRLERSFERLSQFSSDITHELRTPVNNLRGELEVTLGKERSIEDYQEVIQSSLEETNRLSRIIDSLLFLAKAENPKIQIQTEIIILAIELKKIIEFYEPTATDAGITIELAVPGHLSLCVDRTLFQRAIGNILSNAINYTPSGGKILIETIDKETWMTILITDTGEGIAEDHLLKIFDRFYRSDPSRTTSKLGGFGLGLSIVKTILKLHDGDIEIRSKLKQGTQALLTFKKS